MIIVSRDVTDPSIAPFIVADHIVTNNDGSISFAYVDSNGVQLFAGQEPNAYGVRNDNSGIGAYQKFMRQGALVTTVTRPGDHMFTYSLAEGRAF